MHPLAAGAPHSASGVPYTPHVNLNPAPPQMEKEPFAIKVMRLPTPAINTINNITGAITPTPSTYPSASSVSSSVSSSLSSPFSLSSMLLLPTNIGTVYLGETFRAAVSVWQQCASGATLQGVGVKLELQTSSRRWTLVDSTPPAQNVSMPCGTSKDLLVSHNLSELGVTCLVCLVVYRDDVSGERRTFQKFFKFHVHDPFTIHTTIHAREGILLAEVALTSLLHRTVTLGKVVFEPSDARILVEDLNGSSSSDACGAHQLPFSLSEESTNNLLRIRSSSTGGAPPSDFLSGLSGVPFPAGSARSFLFRFTLPPECADLLLGRLQIRWTSQGGENGRIKSSGIARNTSGKVGAAVAGGGIGSMANSGVEATVLDAPGQSPVEQVFPVGLLIRNLTQERRICVLQLLKDRMGTLLPVGPSTRQLGIFSSGAAMPVTIDLVGVGLGVQRIGGIRVSMTAVIPGTNMPNQATTITQDFDHLHQLEITPHKP